MMSQFLCPLLLLVVLIGGTVVLVKASDNAINCGYDVSCHATLKLMTAVSDIKNQLHELSGKQATDLEELKVNSNRSLASTVVISDMSETLGKLAAIVRGIQNKPEKDVEELKVKLDRSFASTAAISTKLDKHT